MLLLRDLNIHIYPQLGSALIDSDLRIRVPTYGYNGGILALTATRKMTELGPLNLNPALRFTNKIVDGKGEVKGVANSKNWLHDKC